MLNTSTLTASDARDNLYSLIKSASKGLRTFEIKLRGADPVVLISKAEIESWLETLDILNNPEEIKSIKKARQQTKSLSHQQMLKQIGLHETKN